MADTDTDTDTDTGAGWEPAGSVVVVTGGTFGIGRSISLTLARAGHRVVAFGLEQPQPGSVAAGGLSELAPLADKEGLALVVLEADVSQPDAVAEVVGRTMTQFGRIDALVNNAAIGPLGTVLDTDPSEFDRIVATNLRGPYLTSRAVLPHMIGQGGGAIVNIGSGAAWGKPNMAVYGATKAALYGLTMCLAHDHFAHHVRVNLVIPGGGDIVSGMTLGRAAGDEVRVRAAGRGTVAGRAASGDDVAAAVTFLLSPAASVISGTVLDVGCFAGQGAPLSPGTR